MIKHVNPPFYNGNNLLLLDQNPSEDVLNKILALGIKCYCRTMDDLHPHKIRDAYPRREERCLIVTINPSVIDHKDYDSAQHVMDCTYFLRGSEIFGFTMDEAHDFKSSYDVGIQHVSEIMLTNGYWR